MAGKARSPNKEIRPDLSTQAFKRSKFNDPSLLHHSLGNSSKHTRFSSDLNLERFETLPSPDESLSEGDQKGNIGSNREEEKSLRPSVVGSLSSYSTMTLERSEQQETMGREGGDNKHSLLMGEHALYQDLSFIGNGAYGTVYKAKDAANGQVVALKKVRVPITDDGLPTSTLREISALKQLERFEHPQIVKLLDVCQGNYLQVASGDEKCDRIDRGLTLWLVFEHVERDLASFMSDYQSHTVPSQLLKEIAREILLGVDFLHSHRIIHRDLKPQNILVTKDGHIKIADFGLAKTYDFEMRLTSVVVTLWYRAPEILLGCTYATPIDIWSIACIFAEINGLKALFPGTSEGDQLDKIFRIIGTPAEEEWPENVSLAWSAFAYRHSISMKLVIPNLSNSGVDLVKNMLIFNPHKRPTAAEALKHRYFIEA